MTGVNGILLHAVVITPVCQYLLTSNKFPKPRNIIFAVAFLAAVAMAGEFTEWQSRPSNYYRVLGVDRGCSPAELKKAYRDATLKYHPDKNKSPDAPLMFQTASDAYETLNDGDLRRLYERYGAEAVKDVRARAALSQRSDGDALLGLAGFYVMWSVLTYLLTLGKTRTAARTWSFVGLIVSLFVEFQMTFGGFDPLSSLLSRTTTSEKIALMHSLYPAFMHGCILIAQFTFVDADALQMMLLQTILVQQQELRDIMRHVVQVVDKKNGAAFVAGSAAGHTSAEGDESLTLAQRVKRLDASAAKAMSDANQKQSKGGIPGWVIMIGLYFVFNYLLK